MNTRKSLKIYYVREHFYGTNRVQDIETQQVWTFWSNYPDAKKKIKIN